MNIINPPYSFVQFAAIPVECGYPLPVALDEDLKFQLIVQTANATESAAFLAEDQQLFVVNPDAMIGDEESLAANTILNQAYVFFTTQISDTQIVLCWTFGLQEITSLAEKECFRLCLRIDSGTAVQYYTSNCFTKVVDLKYSSTLEYYSLTNNYGFNYCDGCSNKVRLPLHIGMPQPKEEQTVYIYSNGQRKLLQYSASKLYELDTDFLPEDIHDKITTALAHDSVNISAAKYTGGIRKDGDYTIAWDRMQDESAPASTKVYATPYMIANDACADCGDYVPPILCAKIISINASAEPTPVACASISSLNATAEKESTGFGVVLGRDSFSLTATVSGGVAPFHYHFYCLTEGDCQYYTIDSPDQDTSLRNAVTAYTMNMYGGTTYSFYVKVTDSTGRNIISSPNVSAMCLLVNTLITMADGSKKALRYVQSGDALQDIDLLTGEKRITYANSVQGFVVNKIYRLNEGLLQASEGHVNVVKDGNDIELIQSVDLVLGDVLLSDELNEIILDSIDVEDGEFEVINLSTSTGTFIANGVLTHNKMACPEDPIII